jgi:hypothetical protein
MAQREDRLSIKESLLLLPRHICDEYAKMYLYPPSKGTDGYIKTAVGRLKVFPVDSWHLDINCGEYLVYVSFCPWCGTALLEGNTDG